MDTRTKPMPIIRIKLANDPSSSIPPLVLDNGLIVYLGSASSICICDVKQSFKIQHHFFDIIFNIMPLTNSGIAIILIDRIILLKSKDKYQHQKIFFIPAISDYDVTVQNIEIYKERYIVALIKQDADARSQTHFYKFCIVDAVNDKLTLIELHKDLRPFNFFLLDNQIAIALFELKETIKSTIVKELHIYDINTANPELVTFKRNLLQEPFFKNRVLLNLMVCPHGYWACVFEDNPNVLTFWHVSETYRLKFSFSIIDFSSQIKPIRSNEFLYYCNKANELIQFNLNSFSPVNYGKIKNLNLINLNSNGDMIVCKRKLTLYKMISMEKKLDQIFAEVWKDIPTVISNIISGYAGTVFSYKKITLNLSGRILPEFRDELNRLYHELQGKTDEHSKRQVAAMNALSRELQNKDMKVDKCIKNVMNNHAKAMTETIFKVSEVYNILNNIKNFYQKRGPSLEL